MANFFNSKGGSFLGEVDPSSITPARTARDLYIHTLTEMSKDPSIMPLSTYKEILRYLIAKFGTFVVLDSQNKLINVKCIHARPERAIAKMTQTTNIILPTCSVAQIAIQEAENRRRIHSMLMHETGWDEKKQRAVRILRFADRPVTLTYSLNFWAKYISHIDQLSEQVRLMFNPTLSINTPLESGTPAFLERESDDSKVVLSDREDRIIRKSFNIRIETYIKSPRFLVTSTGKITVLNSDTGIIT